MRIWFGMLLLLGCGSSSANLPKPDLSGKNHSQQSRASIPNKETLGSDEKPVTFSETHSLKESENDQPEPESDQPEIASGLLTPTSDQPEDARGLPTWQSMKPCHTSPSTADELISRMNCEYRSIGQYQDKGTVVIDLKGNKQTIVFETHFVRPNRFHFEFTTHHPYPPLHHVKTVHTIWAKDKRVRTTFGGRYHLNNIQSAIAGFTGISYGAAYLTPTLLMPIHSQPNPWTSSDTPASKRGIERIDGIPCHRVTLVTKFGPTELWIGRTDFLLRKLTSSDTEITLSVDTSSTIPVSVFSKP